MKKKYINIIKYALIFVLVLNISLIFIQNYTSSRYIDNFEIANNKNVYFKYNTFSNIQFNYFIDTNKALKNINNFKNLTPLKTEYIAITNWKLYENGTLVLEIKKNDILFFYINFNYRTKEVILKDFIQKLNKTQKL